MRRTLSRQNLDKLTRTAIETQVNKRRSLSSKNTLSDVVNNQ